MTPSRLTKLCSFALLFTVQHYDGTPWIRGLACYINAMFLKLESLTALTDPETHLASTVSIE